MKMHRRNTSIVPLRWALLAALMLASPLAAVAQSAPASSSGTVPMDMGAMPGMDHAGMQGMMPATAGSAAKPAMNAPVKTPNAPDAPAPSSAGMHDMSGMDHGPMPEMDHGSMPGMNHGPAPATPATSDHAMPGMAMGPMQDGRASTGARSGDYSGGIAASPAHQLHMHGGAPAGMLLVDQLEAFHGRDGNGQSWEAEGWYGSDADKLWLRSEGERSGGRLEDGEFEALWNHAVAAFWSTQLGVRHDFGAGPQREWVAFGLQGLAPYWFEVEATAYVGPSGRTAARLRAHYELLFTQRLVLQPEFEMNVHGRSDPARRIGSGLTDAKLGLRLRYEIRREFAPYIGVVWTRRFGATADFARADHHAALDRQWVAGVRIWF
jgi:copper resistance protein B